MSEFQTRIDIPDQARVEEAALLNLDLADLFNLASQVKQSHWNVKGAQFMQLHLMFDQFTGDLLGYADTVAERITALGGFAAGTIRAANESSRLSEIAFNAVDGLIAVDALATVTAQMCALVRTDIATTHTLGDEVTSNMLQDIGGKLDKWLWFLEAHLQHRAVGRP